MDVHGRGGTRPALNMLASAWMVTRDSKKPTTVRREGWKL